MPGPHDELTEMPRVMTELTKGPRTGDKEEGEGDREGQGDYGPYSDGTENTGYTPWSHLICKLHRDALLPLSFLFK